MGDHACVTGMLLRLRGKSHKVIRARKGELHCHSLCWLA